MTDGVDGGTVADVIGLLDYAEEFGDWGAAMEARRVLKTAALKPEVPDDE